MLKKLSTKPVFYELNDKNRTIIHLFFFVPYKKSDILNAKLTNRMILNYNKNIERFNELRRKKEELYIMNYSIDISNNVLTSIIDVRFCIPKSTIIDGFSIDDAFKFLHDCLFNPLIDKNKFKEEQFNYEKNYLLNREIDYPHSIYEYATDQFLDFFDKDKKLSLHYDEYMKMLKKVTAKSAYDYYKKSILNNNFATYIYGNLEQKKEILKSYNKYFKQNNKELKYELQEFNYPKFKKYEEKNIITKYNQSVLNLYYQVKDIRDKDYYPLLTLYFFLNSRENDLIYKNLRRINNLIYDSKVFYSGMYGNLGIRVFFNKDDENIILDIIKMTFNDIKVKENFNNYKSNLLQAIKYDLYSSEDNSFYEIDNKIDSEVYIHHSLEEKLKEIEKITFDDMLDLLNRLTLTRKMTMIEGDKNE